MTLKPSPLFIAFFAVCTLSTAMAQPVPSTVEAGRVQKDIERDFMLPMPEVSTSVDSAAAVDAPEGADKVFFVLSEVELVGANAIPREKLAAIYQPYMGKRTSAADIYTIANNITKLYREKGYLLSRAVVPSQKIADGSITIQVIEGFISDYHIEGQVRGGNKELHAYARQLVEQGPLTSVRLERYLLLMNDLPGMRVRSVLKPSPNVQGAAEITLIAEQDNLEGQASVDNLGNSFIGPMRLTATGKVNSAFRSTDEITGTFLWAPNSDELRYYSAGMKKNIGDEGTKIGVHSSFTKTDPTLPPTLGGLLEPEGESFGIILSVDHPFIRSRQLNVFGGLSFDITENKTDFAPGLAAIETKDVLRVLRANAQMSYLDRWSGYTHASGGLSKGVGIFGASNEGDLNLSRPNGDPDFTKLSASASRWQKLVGPFSALLGVTGQYAFNPLLASEEFGFGGTDYGRGYDSSEITGDQGLATKIELSYAKVVGRPYLSDYQIYTFYDIGKVWNRDPGAGQDDSESAASTGVGTRFAVVPAVTGDIFIAKPLTHDIPSRGLDSDDWRVKFSVNSRF